MTIPSPQREASEGTDALGGLSSGKRFGGGDRVFSGMALSAGLTILVALAAVFVFLLVKGLPGFSADPEVYGPSSHNIWGYAGRLLYGTTLAAAIAMVIAVPF